MGDVIQFPVRPRTQPAAQAQPPASTGISPEWKALGLIFVGLAVIEGVKYWSGAHNQPTYLPREPSRIAKRRR